MKRKPKWPLAKISQRRPGSRAAGARHPFISIEGLSGSGKTTVATQLAALIGGVYYKTPPARLAATRLVVDQTWGSVARHLYYYAGVARASEEIAMLLRRRPVVCDKYFATVVAYSRAMGVAVRYPPIYPIIEPDFTFLLVVPSKARRMRLKRRGEITARHAAFLRMETKATVFAEYRKLSLAEIDNAGPDAQVTCKRIIDYLRRAGAVWPKP